MVAHLAYVFVLLATDLTVKLLVHLLYIYKLHKMEQKQKQKTG